jgi:hypothetical protein
MVAYIIENFNKKYSQLANTGNFVDCETVSLLYEVEAILICVTLNSLVKEKYTASHA